MKKHSFIVSSNKVEVDHVLHLTAKGTWILSAIVFLVFGGVFLASLMNAHPKNESAISVVLPPRLEGSPLENIGRGPLALRPSCDTSVLPDLSDEVTLVLQNTKPIKEKKQDDLILRLESSKEQCRVKSGEAVFLSCDPVIPGQAPVYHFSEERTPLWILPTVFAEGKVLIETCHFSVGEQKGESSEEKVQFFLKEKQGNFSKIGGLFVEELKRIKVWGEDVFLLQFAGNKYRSLKNKVKIEIPGMERVSFSFVGVGDMISWAEEGWKPATNEGNLGSIPLAKVKSISPRGIEWQVWDGEGFTSSYVFSEKQMLPKTTAKSDGFIHSVRMRTSTQVSCVFGKKHCLIREGDWIVKTDFGIRNLKRAEDIQGYLQHKLVGELFVFDSIEEVGGARVLRGFWIDKMRTQSTPCTIPILSSSKNKVTLKKEKKSPFMKKKQEETITYFPEIDGKEERGI